MVISSDRMANDTQVLQDLENVTAGLLFMSESDFPFELIKWTGMAEITPDFIRTVTAETKDCPVQEIDVDDFLSSGLYQPLLVVLRSQLLDLKAYKVGRINMPVYLVGRSREGSWLGVATRVVQT